MELGRGTGGRVTLGMVSFAFVAILMAGCSAAPQVSPSAPDSAGGDAATLDAVEVREYEGKKLGSVDDFRENSIKGPQTVAIEGYRLRIEGEVDKPTSLTYDQVIDRETFRKVVTLNCIEGWSVDILWEGVRLVDLLEQAGYNTNAKVVIFRCYDGYSTSLPLKTVVDRDLLLAYKMNGIDLPTERGYPFQVVAEDKYGYKWAKWVTSIEVSDDANFKGYWESRGYSNDAEFGVGRSF